jgi:hypothetical protein
MKGHSFDSRHNLKFFGQFLCPTLCDRSRHRSLVKELIWYILIADISEVKLPGEVKQNNLPP